MIQTKKAAPRRGPRGGRVGARKRLGQVHDTRNGAGRQVFASNGRVVGEVRDGVLRKTVRRSVHFLRYPRAIAWDLVTLEQAERLGATRCEVADAETGDTYSASLAAFWREGVRLNRGHGDQVALPLDRWAVARPGEAVGQQLALALGV